jgi:putative flavoprotein involved in K+ transport
VTRRIRCRIRLASKFETALKSSDIKAAAALFDDECYWRDLVSFTWNIKTMEGRGEIEAMLAATLSQVKPSNWKIEGTTRQKDGATEGWFTFETAAERGAAGLSQRRLVLLTTVEPGP